MKFAFLVVFAFFISLAARSRNLSYKEKMSILAADRHLELKSYFVDQIVPSELPINEYITYKVLKNSCAPLTMALEKIDLGDEELKDQSRKLRIYYVACMEGTLGLGDLYQKYNK